MRNVTAESLRQTNIWKIDVSCPLSKDGSSPDDHQEYLSLFSSL